MGALALQSFGFEGQTVRVMDQEGSPWFVAQDVCSCLELANTSKSISSLDDDEKGVTISYTLGGDQQVLIISESGLYALIFKSRKPAAIRFRKWVTSEVLPTLRRTGRFEMTPANEDDPVNAPDAVERWKLALATVREARVIYGRGAAAKMWVPLGLPDPGGERAKRAVDLAVMPTLAMCVERWAQSRLLPADENARIRTEDLYADYLAWCERERQSAISLPSFGKQLSMHRIGVMYSNGAWRLGVKLAD